VDWQSHWRRASNKIRSQLGCLGEGALRLCPLKKVLKKLLPTNAVVQLMQSASACVCVYVSDVSRQLLLNEMTFRLTHVYVKPVHLDARSSLKVKLLT